MPTLRISNTRFFTVLDPFPLENIGWEVKVYMRNNPNTLVAIVPRWSRLSGAIVLNDVGAGEVQILRDDRIFTDALPSGVISEIIEDETIWKFYWNGTHRFSIYCEDLDKNHVDEKERATVRVTGRSTGKILEHATVLPIGFPTYADLVHHYTGVSAMSAWSTLYDEALARGALPAFFSKTFTVLLDTAGDGWLDISNLEVSPGGNLLDYLRRWAVVSGVEWQVNKNNQILVRREIGSHREDQVIFNISGSVLKLGEQKTRRDIKTHVFAEGAGTVVQAVDTISSTKWGRREIWVAAPEAADASTVGNFANSSLEALKDESRQITVKVLPDRPGRTVFVDYDIGDWVGIEIDAPLGQTPFTDVVKVVAISWVVDENGKMDLELTLSTRLQERVIRIQQALARLGANV